MKNKLIPNEKQILAGIKKECDGIKHHKSALLKFAFALGEKLISAKKLVPHGQWENWINTHEECDFSDRQAQKYMSIAADKKIAAKLFPTINSVDGLCKALASVTDEQRAEIEAEEEAKKAAKVEAQPVSQTEPKPEPKTSQSEPIDVEFTEVKPEKVAANEPDLVIEETLEQVLTEANEILQKDNEELLKEIESVTKVLESNDQVTTALAEVKKFKELNRVLNERITGLQNEKNEAIRSVKHWKGRAERAEKELASKVLA